MLGSSESWLHQQQPYSWHYVPVEEPSTASEADIAPLLFDHLVGPPNQCVRDFESERLGSLEVDA
jgi:hypothetical protein